MSGNDVKVISAVMVGMLDEKMVTVTVTVTVTVMGVKAMGYVKDGWGQLRAGSGSGCSRCRSWYSVSHTTDSVWASCPTQRPGNIR